MSERKIKNLLENILEHIKAIEECFGRIKQPSDFIKDLDGGILPDAISIRCELLNHEVIFDPCRRDIPLLREVITSELKNHQ